MLRYFECAFTFQNENVNRKSTRGAKEGFPYLYEL